MVKRHCIPASRRASRMPVTPEGRTGRASGAFTLVECVVMAVLVGCLIVGSVWYYQGISSDARLGIAQEELKRIAEEIPRWALTHPKPPRSTIELPRLGGRELLDP